MTAMPQLPIPFFEVPASSGWSGMGNVNRLKAFQFKGWYLSEPVVSKMMLSIFLAFDLRLSGMGQW